MLSTSDFLETASPNVAAFLADISTLNVSLGQGLKGDIAYGVFGARSNDRYWLLPLAPRAATRAGLRMFQPASWIARCAHELADNAMRARLDRLWARRYVQLSGLPDMKADFGQPVAACAYFTGTAGPHRKTAIQAMATNGTILGYGKLTRDPGIIPFLSAEAAMLNKLSDLKLITASIPRLLAFQEMKEGAALLVTDSRRSRHAQSPTHLVKDHLTFLIELKARTGKTADPVARKTLAQKLDHMANIAGSAAWRNRFADGAYRLRSQTFELRTVLTHGDFTPWNIFLDSQGLYVFDWEYAEDAYPLGYDIARFLLCLPRETSITTQSRLAVDRIAASLFDGDTASARAHFHLSLLLHAGFYLERSALSKNDTWIEEDRYGALIDDQG